MAKQPKEKTPKTPKGDKMKPYDVIISGVYDDRAGTTSVIEKPTRISFATEGEALDYLAKLKAVQ